MRTSATPIATHVMKTTSLQHCAKAPSASFRIPLLMQNVQWRRLAAAIHLRLLSEFAMHLKKPHAMPTSVFSWTFETNLAGTFLFLVTLNTLKNISSYIWRTATNATLTMKLYLWAVFVKINYAFYVPRTTCIWSQLQSTGHYFFSNCININK